jgi:type I restriction enzyme, S subunit
MSDPQDQLIPLEQVAAPGPHSFVDGPFGSEMKSSEYSERGVRLVQLQNIGDGYWIDDNKKFIPLEKFETLRRHGAIPGDIAIAKMADPVARSCVLPAVADQFIVVADCIKLTPDPERFDARFVSAAINSHRTRCEAEMKSSGTTRLRINLSALKTVHVWAPQFSEQRQIALTLDTEDEAIAKTEAVIAKLKQVRAGLLHDLLTRGLDEHGQLRDPITHPEHFQDTPLGCIPCDWTSEPLGARLQRSAGIIQTGPFGSQLHAHEYTTEGVPVVMPQDIVDGDFADVHIVRIPPWKAEELRRHRLKLGDLIFARRGDLSRCAVVTEREVGWLCGTGCLLMRFKQAILSPSWVSLAYRHDFGQRQIAARAVGTTMVNLNTTLLAHLVFAFPPKEEQENIVWRVAETEALLREESANLAKLCLVKSGLMADLLTGCVRVPESVATVENQP